MSTEPVSSYDELPYGNNCFPFTHPDHLATLGGLYGIEPPDIARCRVLELGCAGGANLISMAQGLPDAQFAGVDLSARQVAEGRAIIAELELRNIRLEARNIAEVDERFGTFDYIICHGVFSWVPAPVRDKILSISSERLAPNGIAYISYNTYPGWHARGLVRDLMAFHVRRTAPALDRVAKAREFLGELVRVVPDQASAYARILRNEEEFLREVGNPYLYHEHLEETNHPLYFHEFMALAEQKGLRFLSEARTPGLIDNLPDEPRAVLDRWADDETAAEQYLDFLSNRTFRRTLLCHAGQPRNRSASSDRVASLWATTDVFPESSSLDLVSDAAETFRKRDRSASLSTNKPVVKTALFVLSEAWPRSIHFPALWERVRTALGYDESEPAEPLREALLRCYLSNLIELQSLPHRFATEAGERPVASPLARIQARDNERVTNLRHRSVELGAFDRLVLRHLDGTRDRQALLDQVAALVESDEFSIQQNDEPIRDPGRIREILSAELGPCLARLAGSALLTA